MKKKRIVLYKVRLEEDKQLRNHWTGVKVEEAKQIADIVEVTEIPTDLSTFGVKKSDLNFLVEAGSKQTRLLVNNRRELSLDDIRTIYLKVLK